MKDHPPQEGVACTPPSCVCCRRLFPRAATAEPELLLLRRDVRPKPRPQWRGFLLDQRTLRSLAVKSPPGVLAGGPRGRYQADVERLTKLAGSRKLSADEAADLGALYIPASER